MVSEAELAAFLEYFVSPARMDSSIGREVGYTYLMVSMIKGKFESKVFRFS